MKGIAYLTARTSWEGLKEQEKGRGVFAVYATVYFHDDECIMNPCLQNRDMGLLAGKYQNKTFNQYMEFLSEIDFLKTTKENNSSKSHCLNRREKTKPTVYFSRLVNQWQPILILKFVPDALHRAGVNSCALPAARKPVTQSWDVWQHASLGSKV